MTILANLKNDLQDRICDIKAVFDEATTLQATPQEFEQIEYVQKIIDLTLEATTKFRDIEARHRDDIETTELDTFRTSLTNIKDGKAKIHAAIRARNVDKIASIDNKARARELQETSRTQQCNTGKQSTQPEYTDTALPTIRPAPVPPEEHYDTAGGEDHRHKEANGRPPGIRTTTVDAGPNIEESLEDKMTLFGLSTPDTAPPVTRPVPDTNRSDLARLKSKHPGNDTVEQKITQQENCHTAKDHTQPSSNLVEVKDKADWKQPVLQPVEASTLDAAPHVTKPAP